MMKKEYYDVVMTIVSVGHTTALQDLRARYKKYTDEYTVPFPTSANFANCVYGFSQTDKTFLESLQYLPTLSVEAIKKYAEFFRNTDNRGMMQAMQKYAEDHGYTITGLLEDPETMLAAFDSVLAKATEIIEMDKTDSYYDSKKIELRFMIDQVLTPEEIVVTAKN